MGDETTKQVRIQFVADTSRLKQGAKQAKESMEGVKESVQQGSKSWSGFSSTLGKISGSFGKISSGISDTMGVLGEVFTKVKKSTKSVKLAIIAVLAVIAIKVAKVAWQIANATAKAFDSQAYEKAMNEREQGMKRLKTAVGAFTSPIVNAINSAIGWFLSGLAKMVQSIHAGLAFIWGFITGLLQPAIDAIGVAIDAVKKAVNAVIDAIKNGINAIASFLGFGEVFKQAEAGAKDTSDAIEEVGESSEYATGALQGFDKLNTMDAGDGDQQTADEIKDTSDAMQTLGKTISGSLTKWIGDTIGAIPEKLGEVWEGIKEKAREVIKWLTDLPQKVKEVAQKAWQKFVDIFRGIGAWLKDKLKAVLEFDWMGLWNKFCEVMGGVGTWIWDKLTGVLDFDWGELWTQFTDAMGGVKDWIWEKLTQVLPFDWTELWNGLTTAMKDLKTWLWNKLTEVLTFDWSELWEGFCKAMGNLATWIKDKIVAGVQDAINAITGPINSLINGAKSLVGLGDSDSGSSSSSSSSGSTSSSSGSSGGTKLSDQVKSYPVIGKPTSALLRLFGKADGGVAMPNNPFPVIVGDNTREPEVISPVSTMKQAFKEALAESGMMTGGRSSQSQSGTIVLQVDGKTLARATYDDLIAEGNRRGRRTIA